LFPLPRGFSSKRAIITGRFKYSYWNMIQRFVQPVNSRRAAGRKIIAAVRTQSHETLLRSMTWLCDALSRNAPQLWPLCQRFPEQMIFRR
jgi:hypothetical protein